MFFLATPLASLALSRALFLPRAIRSSDWIERCLRKRGKPTRKPAAIREQKKKQRSRESKRSGRRRRRRRRWKRGRYTYTRDRLGGRVRGREGELKRQEFAPQIENRRQPKRMRVVIIRAPVKLSPFILGELYLPLPTYRTSYPPVSHPRNAASPLSGFLTTREIFLCASRNAS